MIIGKLKIDNELIQNTENGKKVLLIYFCISAVVKRELKKTCYLFDLEFGQNLKTMLKSKTRV